MPRPAVRTRSGDLASLFEVTRRPDADGFARDRNDETDPPGERRRTGQHQRRDGSDETERHSPSSEDAGEAHAATRRWTALITSATLMSSMQRSIFLHFRS